MRTAFTTVHSWRRFLRFSVRGMVVLVLLIGFRLGWLVRCARIQREAAAAIEKAGGKVYYGGSENLGRWAPKWLLDAVGNDCVVSVDAAQTSWKATDAEMEQVGRLSTLVRLSITGWGVTESGVARLKGLDSLESIDFNGSRISDDGLAHLSGLTPVTWGSWGSCGVIVLGGVGDAVASGLLGLVEGTVGGIQEVRDIGQVGGIPGGADAEAGGDPSMGPSLRFDRRAKRFSDRLGHAGIHSWKQYDELFTSGAGHQITRARIGPESGRDQSQHFVAGCVAELVVV